MFNTNNPIAGFLTAVFFCINETKGAFFLKQSNDTCTL